MLFCLLLQTEQTWTGLWSLQIWWCLCNCPTLERRVFIGFYLLKIWTFVVRRDFVDLADFNLLSHIEQGKIQEVFNFHQSSVLTVRNSDFFLNSHTALSHSPALSEWLHHNLRHKWRRIRPLRSPTSSCVKLVLKPYVRLMEQEFFNKLMEDGDVITKRCRT